MAITYEETVETVLKLVEERNQLQDFVRKLQKEIAELKEQNGDRK